MNSTDFEEPKREQTRVETDKKCENCGGTLEFDPSAGDLHCPYCDAHFPIPKEESENKDSSDGISDDGTAAMEQIFADAVFFADCNWGAETKTVICKSCGAQSIYDELMLAAACPYCGSNQVMEEKNEKTLAPGGVCTFKVDNKTAADKFRKWLKGKWFCPSEAKKNASPDKISGVYIPVWTFDSDTNSVYTGEYGKEHRYRDSKGNTHTRIDWHSTSGVYSRFINDHLQLATDRFDAKMYNNLLPYNTEQNLKYKPEYISGFISERYSVGLGTAWERAKEALKSILRGGIESEIKDRHNTSHVRKVNFKTVYNNIKYKYLLTPVWISTYMYKNKTYRFMVNGETGKVSGSSPVSVWRVLFAILIGLLILAILYWIFRNS